MPTILSEFKRYDKEVIIDLIGKIQGLIYARVSTQDQANKGYSLTSQIEKCLEFARDKFGYSDDQLLVIVEKGEMGDNPDRPGLNHALYVLEEGIGKKFIMLHPDRLSRFLALQSEIASRVWSRGADLEFVELDIDPDNPESMLMFNIQGSIAQYNKAKILANSKRGRYQKVKEGKIPGVRRVFGYTYDKVMDTLVENPKEKEIYLLMVEWLLKGKDGEDMNCSKIARELAKRQHPAPSGNKWYQATVSRIVKNEIYKGTFFYGKTEMVQNRGKKEKVNKPKKEWYSIPIPPYIDELTYGRILERIKKNRKNHAGRKTNNYLVKGLVRCGRCGGAVVAGPATTLKSGKSLRYYACSRKAKKNYEVGTGAVNEVCRGCNWRQDAVDDHVWREVVKGLKTPERIIQDMVRKQKDVQNIKIGQQRIEQLKNMANKKEEELRRCLTAYKEGVISLKIFKEESESVTRITEQLHEKIAWIKHCVKQAKEKNSEGHLLQDYKSIYKTLMSTHDLISFEKKRNLINKHIAKVILYDEMIHIITSWRKADP